MLASLAPVERQLAEQVLRGGLAAVRQAVEEQNAAARIAGEPEIGTDAIIAMAEDLVPVLMAAEWHDRAEAAVAIIEEVSLRDLRSVVVGPGADLASRDEECRALGARLRDALGRRQAQERQDWIDDITGSVGDGRVVRALRVSSRPPQPGMRLPAELVTRLSEVVGQSMGAKTTADRWTAILEAVAASPLRNIVKPVALPESPGDDLLAAMKRASARIPGLAKLLTAVPTSESALTVDKQPATGTPVDEPEATATPPEATATPPEATATPPEATATPAVEPDPPAIIEETPSEAPSGDKGEDPVVVEELHQAVDQPKIGDIA